MILLRKLYCVGCRKNSLHIIFIQRNNSFTYGLTAICLDMCCIEVRYLTLCQRALTELAGRTRDDEPKTKGGI